MNQTREKRTLMVPGQLWDKYLDEGTQGGRFRVTFYVVEEYSNCKEFVSVEQQSILDCNGFPGKIATHGQETK